MYYLYLSHHLYLLNEIEGVKDARYSLIHLLCYATLYYYVYYSIPNICKLPLLDMEQLTWKDTVKIELLNF